MLFVITYMWNIKSKMFITKQRKAHRYREITSGYQWEEGQHRHMEWEVPIIGCKAQYVQLYICTICTILIVQYVLGNIANVL